jgi:Leucine-rich repeat (LRR) protein
MKAVRGVFVIALLLWSATSTIAQQGKAEVKQNEQKVRDMVKFLEYVLNTLGNSATSARDKDVLVTESFTKIFRDGKVQVEDDLVEKRNVITNKDVQAYLKDVDFFYDDVKFEFNIKEIKGSLNSNNKLFYKVSLIRNLRGTTVEGKTVNNTSPRFIEINYDPKDKDLKIVSIYTKEFDQRGALLSWWKTLPYEWQSFFKKKLNLVTDSVQLTDIQNVMAINAIDLSAENGLQNLEPLAQLADLQSLNLANTTITDLSALRNLTGLVDLNLSNTKVQDISPLKYSDNLVSLNINHTPVTEIAVLERMAKLERLEMRNTDVTDFTPLANVPLLKYLDIKNTRIISLAPVSTLTNLTELNVSGTTVDDLAPLSTLKGLSTLSLDSTRIYNIAALSSLENLVTLSINYTTIGDLSSLQGLKKLERVYCDGTGINRPLADAFMTARPGVLVIYNSEDLRGWWDALAAPWKEIFTKAAAIGATPTNEELAKIPNLDSLNLSGNGSIKDIEPLKRLQKLKVLNVEQTSVSDLIPLRDNRSLRSLNVNGTKVTNLDVARNLPMLAVLKAEQTGVTNVDALSNSSALKKLYVDDTSISDSVVRTFLQKQPQCLVVYKTDSLTTWWNDLPGAWREVFEGIIPVSQRSIKEDLHRLAELETLKFKDATISNLSVLGIFVRLKELEFSGTSISDLSPLMDVKSLRILRATNSPIRNLEPLRMMTELTELDVSNTPVEELRPIRGLTSLKTFNCSGTQVSSLTPLESIETIESLDCSNTGVKKLDPLMHLPLKTLKCYNTKISGKAVNKFKNEHPDCNVVHY